MKIQPHITLTGLPVTLNPDQAMDLTIAVRVDFIAVVQRGLANVEQPPTPGASGPGKPKPKQVECTFISLSIGGQLLVREPVDEVLATMRKAQGRRLW